VSGEFMGGLLLGVFLGGAFVSLGFAVLIFLGLRGRK
jgi:hypothetical protein